MKGTFKHVLFVITIFGLFSLMVLLISTILLFVMVQSLLTVILDRCARHTVLLRILLTIVRLA